MRYNIKSYLPIMAFLLFGAMVFAYSIKQRSDEELAIKVFSKPPASSALMINSRFFLTDRGEPQISVYAEEMESFDDNDFHFISPRANIFHINGPSLLTAVHGELRVNADTLRLRGEVKLTHRNGYHYSDRADVEITTQKAFFSGNVEANYKNMENKDQIFLYSHKGKAFLKEQKYFYSGEVRGKIKPSISYRPVVDFSASELNIIGLDSVMHLNDEVRILRANMQAQSNRAEFFLNNSDKKLKYYVLYDDVRVKETIEQNGGQVSRHAYGEKLEGYTVQSKVILSGTPRVVQDGDEIKGYRITMREDVDILEVEDSASSFAIEKEE